MPAATPAQRESLVIINVTDQAQQAQTETPALAPASEAPSAVFSRRNLIIAGLLALGTFLFYLVLEKWWQISLHGGNYALRNGTAFSYFAFQADGWLHGTWALPLTSIRTDLIELHGQFYSIYGPFPAVLMLPLVAIFGPNVSDTLFVLVISALNTGLLFLLFEQLRASGLTTRDWRENVVWAIFLYLGSTALSLSLGGGVWYTGHIVACACVLVSLILAFRRHYVWSAVALTCAFFSRPTLLFGFPFLFYLAWQDGATGTLFQHFVVSLWRRRPDWTALPWRRLRGVAAVFVGCIALYLLRNWSMFGNPLESGYGIQLVQRYPFITHGVYNFRYIPANIINDFFNFPHIVFGTHYTNSPIIDLGNGGNGLSVFLTTPLFLFLFTRNRERSWLRVALWVTILATVAFVLMFYTAGYPQVGTRYLFDIYPFAWVLLLISNVKLDWRVVVLGVFALVFNIAGSYQHWTHVDYFHIPRLPTL